MMQQGNISGETTMRVFQDPDMPRPAVQLLSNGRYHVMVSSSGAGYSRCRDLAVNRWHEDITSDNWGQFCYLRDVETGEFWSTTFQPTLVKPEHFEAIFSDARAEFRVRDTELRCAYRNRRVAGRRYRIAPRPHDQSRPNAAYHRDHHAMPKLADRAGDGRCIASGVQQSVRADGMDRVRTGDYWHASATFQRRACAVDVSCDDGARCARRCDLL